MGGRGLATANKGLRDMDIKGGDVFLPSGCWKHHIDVEVCARKVFIPDSSISVLVTYDRGNSIQRQPPSQSLSKTLKKDFHNDGRKV